MANNPYVNKVQYGDQTLMDLTEDTVTPEDVAEGVTFHDRSGAQQTGTGNYYSPNDTAETDIVDGDYFPFYDTSASGKRKTLWSNVKAKLKAYFNGIYGIKVGEPLLKDTVGWVGKNVFAYPYKSETKTENGVTFTDNKDGSVTISIAQGGATADSTFYFHDQTTGIRNSLLKANKLILSGGISSNIYINIWNAKGDSASVASTGDEALVDFTNQNNDFNIILRVKSGTTLANAITIKPMLRKADILDSTYEPYHPSVEQTLRDAEVIEGKNKLPITLDILNANNTSGTWSGNVYTYNNVTYTVETDSDGRVVGITVNGTANALTYFILDKSFNTVKYEGYLINGFVEGSASSFRVSSQNDFVSLQEIIANDTQIQNNGSNCRLSLRLDNGASISNKVFYPMLRDASETDATFEPYYIPLKDSKFDRAEQRVLGAKNWFNAEGAYTKPSSASVTVSDKGKTIRIKADTASTYTNGKWVTNVEPNTDYTITADVTITSGTPSIKIEEAASSVTIVQSARLTQSGKIELSFNSGNRTSVGLVLMSAYNTAEVSDVTFSNTLLRLASDPDDTYAPYAMTNRELTELKESACTNVAGTVQSNNLNKVGKTVELSLSLDAVSASAWNTIAKIPSGYRPKYNIRVGGYDRTTNNPISFQVRYDGDVKSVQSLSSTDIIIYATWITN